MKFETCHGVTVLRSGIFAPFPEVRFAFSTRQGGVSLPPFDSLNVSKKVGDRLASVEENRRRLLTALGIDGSRLAIPKQIHGKRVRYAEKPGDYPDTDALITDQKNIFLVVTVADCVPVVLYEPEKKVLGIAHAGWRGTKQNVVSETIRAMVDRFRILPGNLLGFLGPSIGPCCYEVGDEVADQFPVDFIRRSLGKNPKLDLWEANRFQLQEAGLKIENIEVSRLCTCHLAHQFFSHRAGKGKTGRMWAIVSISN